MGYIKHHAIVVTGHLWDDRDKFRNSDIRDAHEIAVEAGCLVSPIIEGRVNLYASFFVAPDGSKEGWDTSDEGDEARNKLIAWLEKNSPPDEGWFSWAEVVIGSDDHEAYVTRHAWKNEDA